MGKISVCGDQRSERRADAARNRKFLPLRPRSSDDQYANQVWYREPACDYGIKDLCCLQLYDGCRLEAVSTVTRPSAVSFHIHPDLDQTPLRNCPHRLRMRTTERNLVFTPPGELT